MRRARVPLFLSLALIGLACLLQVGAPVQADERADPESYRGYDVGGGLVTLDVNDAPFGEVVRERIQSRTRVNIDVSREAMDLPITLKVVDLHWVLALEAMANKIGAFLVRRAPNLLVIERPKPIEMPEESVPQDETPEAPKIRSFEQRLSGSGRHEDAWNRSPNVTGTGAIHVKSFHCKLTGDSLEFLDRQVEQVAAESLSRMACGIFINDGCCQNCFLNKLITAAISSLGMGI